MIPRRVAIALLVVAMVGAELAVPVLRGDVAEGLRVTEQVLAHKSKPDPPKDPEPPQEPPPPREAPGGPDVPGSVWYVTWAGQIEAGPFFTRDTCLSVAVQLTQARHRPHVCVRYGQ